MTFLALFKLLNPKEWLIVTAIAALTYGGFWLYRHGEQHIETQDAKIEAKQDKQVAAVTTVAKDTESHLDVQYKQTVSTPPAANIGIKCVRESPRTVSLPAAGAGITAAISQPTSDSGSGLSYDPSGAALTRGAKADAQIKYLQGRIRELETQMNGAP